MEFNFPQFQKSRLAAGDADIIYRSSTRRLIDLRRGQQYQMLHDENESYGFRRSLTGLKPIALTVGALTAIPTGLVWWSDMPSPNTLPAILALVKSSPTFARIACFGSWIYFDLHPSDSASLCVSICL